MATCDTSLFTYHSGTWTFDEDNHLTSRFVFNTNQGICNLDARVNVVLHADDLPSMTISDTRLAGLVGQREGTVSIQVKYSDGKLTGLNTSVPGQLVMTIDDTVTGTQKIDWPA